MITDEVVSFPGLELLVSAAHDVFIFIKDYESVFTLLVLILAFAVSVFTYRHSNRMARASVMPIVCVRSGADGSVFYVEIINTGVGPAIIENVDVLIAGECFKYRNSGEFLSLSEKILEYILNGERTFRFNVCLSLNPKFVIRAGEVIRLLDASCTGEVYKFTHEDVDRMSAISFKIKYSDVYKNEYEAG